MVLSFPFRPKTCYLGTLLNIPSIQQFVESVRLSFWRFIYLRYNYSIFMRKHQEDIHWQQRFISYNKVFHQLEKFIADENLNEMETQGLIKSFEYTYELAWKTLQDLLKDKGYKDVTGPKPVIKQSFQDGYIADGEAWMRMHESRNLTSHTYDEETAGEIVEKIRSEYFFLLKNLRKTLEGQQTR